MFITGGGAHTGVIVPVYGPGLQMLGYLHADFQAAAWSGGDTTCSCYLHTPGEISVNFTRTPLGAVRRIKGSPLDDLRVLASILRSSGMTKNDLRNLIKNPSLSRKPGKGLWSTYSVYYRNCNKWTESVIDDYLLEDWYKGFTVWGGDDLIEFWDQMGPTERK